MSSAVRSAASSIMGLLAVAALLFVPAGTLSYWQAWVFLGVFLTVSAVPSGYLYRVDPAAFERRRKAGPKAETRTVQKVVMTALSSKTVMPQPRSPSRTGRRWPPAACTGSCATPCIRPAWC